MEIWEYSLNRHDPGLFLLMYKPCVCECIRIIRAPVSHPSELVPDVPERFVYKRIGLSMEIRDYVSPCPR
jgi:hypothetical protein